MRSEKLLSKSKRIKREMSRDQKWPCNWIRACMRPGWNEGIGFFKIGDCLEAVCSISYSSIIFVSHSQVVPSHLVGRLHPQCI